MFSSSCCIVFVVLIVWVSKVKNENGFAPNIVFILTDDQDALLGGMEPLQKTKNLITNQGAQFTNMYVTTPLCCPSRASILTGRYAHNHKTVNNSLEGGCSSSLWQNETEKSTFVTALKFQDYVTFYAGKYLNQYGDESVGGVEHVPPGWDHWYALVGNSVYYNYTLSVNGVSEIHGNNPDTDYLTNVIRNKSLQFLDTISTNSKPFFMMISPPAPHGPFTPEPKYSKNFSNLTAPRKPNFNIPGKFKHWLLRQPPNPMSSGVIDQVDEIFRNRWRTLLSVDDLTEAVYNSLKDKDLLKNTYIFFSSDNGYHMGQFSLPWDKRQPYEFDIKVPLSVMGPGIKAGTVIQAPVLNIDLANTFMDISGINSPNHLLGLDGFSLIPLLYNDSSVVWRENFVIEHKGSASDRSVPGCPQYRVGEVANCVPDCICQDAINNSYSCVRRITGDNNSLYCKFADDEAFEESYNLLVDPYQLINLSAEPKEANEEKYSYLNFLSYLLKSLEKCINFSCFF